MKKPLIKILPDYFGKCVLLKKTNQNLSTILVNTQGVVMKEIGIRKKHSDKFLKEENAFSIEEIMSDIVFNTYKNTEVFYLLKTDEENFFILRHFKSRKADFYFAINIMPKEEFDEKKVLESAVFFFKKK